MSRLLDIAWLAGVFDGEGCVFVHRSRRRNGRVVSSLALNLANTSTELLRKYIAVLETVGVTSKVTIETRYGTRPIYYVKVARKRDALLFARVIVEFTTAKQSELRMAIWYLERACKDRQHVADATDIRVLDAITNVKHGSELPEDIRNLTGN